MCEQTAFDGIPTSYSMTQEANSNNNAKVIASLQSEVISFLLYRISHDNHYRAAQEVIMVSFYNSAFNH